MKLQEKILWQQEEIRKLTSAFNMIKAENENLKREVSKKKMEEEQLRLVVASIGKVLSVTYGEY